MKGRLKMIKHLVYDYLTLFCYSKHNAIHMSELATAFETSERNMRSIVNAINDDPELEHIVKKGDALGYYVVNELDDIRHMINAELKKIRQSAKRIKKLNQQLREHNQVVFTKNDIEIKNKYN